MSLKRSPEITINTCLNVYGHMQVYSPGMGHINPCGHFFFKLINLLSMCPFPECFPFKCRFLHSYVWATEVDFVLKKVKVTPVSRFINTL